MAGSLQTSLGLEFHDETIADHEFHVETSAAGKLQNNRDDTLNAVLRKKHIDPLRAHYAQLGETLEEVYGFRPSSINLFFVGVSVFGMRLSESLFTPLGYCVRSTAHVVHSAYRSITG